MRTLSIMRAEMVSEHVGCRCPFVRCLLWLNFHSAQYRLFFPSFSVLVALNKYTNALFGGALHLCD